MLYLIPILLGAIVAPNVQADTDSTYTIGFTGPAPLLYPTAGYFEYDSTTDQFVKFLIGWQGGSFDFVSVAPVITAGGPPCIGGATGNQAILALMTDCSPNADQTVTWAAFTELAPTDESCFDFDAKDTSTAGEISLSLCQAPALGRPAAMSGGGFASTYLNPLDTPEPSSVGLLLIGISLVWYFKIRRILPISR